MHIFIDETGTFTGTGTSFAPSLVGALIIPDAKIDEVKRRYEKIRRRFRKERGEVKGRLLNEEQVRAVVDMLRRNEVLFKAVMIDLANHTDVELSEHKRLQGELFSSSLTDEHHPSIHAGVAALKRQLEAMPIQLYVQSVINFEILNDILDRATLYYVQRRPQELAAFHWVVDAKNKGNGITKWEEWWSFCSSFMLQSKSFRKPARLLKGEDYSFFERSFGAEALDEYMQQFVHPIPSGEDIHPIDIKKVLGESFRFSSDPEWGLELVDIVSNAVRRALKGNLNEGGWGLIPSLMIRRPRHYISVVALHRRDTQPKDINLINVMNVFGRNGRDMLVPRRRLSRQ
ncbi:hypothetical protein [uncultured Methylobacterium sp.]|uniref:hypothetical protein n=1 Tax=uncultured Methylobacterium sp. TaxID=157278 RepID=UPI002594C6AD|nr:hypothetical protein [uncultured Methylobacterium sp.]